VVVGTANANAYSPRNIEHVQFSLPVQVAFTLLGRGNGYLVYRNYLADQVDMETVIDLARRIRITEAPDLEQRYPDKFVADATLNFGNDHTEHVFVEDPIGTEVNPMSEAAQDVKYMELTRDILSADRATALQAILQRDDPALPARTLAALCVA
jgi:2-methylcitrate dehydratase PrpD